MKNRFINSLFAACCSLFLYTNALAAGAAEGLWQTQASDEGSYLHVEITPCDIFLCGTIIAAYDKNNEIVPNYENVGKQMLWGMKTKSPNSWKSGKIWAPDVDKTYSSKMEIQGDLLVVSGCVAAGLVCRSQNWKRVKK